MNVRSLLNNFLDSRGHLRAVKDREANIDKMLRIGIRDQIIECTTRTASELSLFNIFAFPIPPVATVFQSPHILENDSRPILYSPQLHTPLYIAGVDYEKLIIRICGYRKPVSVSIAN